MSEGKRVTVVFSNEQYSALQEAAESQGISLAQALRQAIDLGNLVVKAKSENSKVLFKHGSKIQELELAS